MVNGNAMRVCKIYLVFFFVAFSITNGYGLDKKDSLYQVLKIKVTGDYYVIHAQRNDSLFKIISKKSAFNNIGKLQVVTKGSYYYFDFKNAPDGPGDVKPLTGIANYLDVKNSHFFIDGDTKIKFTRRFHRRIYTTRNLIGLYYSP